MLLFLSLFSIQALATLSLGWCPSLQTQPNLNLSKFIGKWFQQIRDLDLVYENGKCNTVSFTQQGPNTLWSNSTELINSSKNTVLSSIQCLYQDGQCSQRFFNVGPERDYKVIMTDYETVAIVYSCTSYLMFHISHFWVLSREAKLKDLEKFTSFLQVLGMPAEKIHFTQSENCLGIAE